MRTIKFRGYAHHQNKWVYGSLLLDGGEAWVTETEQGLFVDMNHQMKLEPVEPETVGQFTGLTDKNGKEIYEGDIVAVWYFEPDAGTEDGWTTFKAFVEYRENEMCFVINVHGKKLVNVDVSKFVEVIGNIHENPELLK